jgi:hypothetical protein
MVIKMWAVPNILNAKTFKIERNSVFESIISTRNLLFLTFVCTSIEKQDAEFST